MSTVMLAAVFVVMLAMMLRRANDRQHGRCCSFTQAEWHHGNKAWNAAALYRKHRCINVENEKP